MNSPTLSSSFFEAGRRWQEEGDLPRAESCYRQALEADPDAVEAWRCLGDVCLALGKPSDAAASYRAALDRQPDLLDAHTGLGVVLAQQGNSAEAEACLREVVRLLPDSAQAHSNLGIVLSQQGRQAEAEACHREALRLQPEFVEAHNNLGLAFAAQDRYSDAEASYLQALRLRPDFAAAADNLDVILRRQGKLAEADARQSVRRGPRSAEAHDRLGIALAEQGQTAAAEACFREAVRCKPDYTDGHYHLGIALLQQGRFKAAEPCHRQAISLRSDFAEAYNGLGIALAGQHKLAEAEACLRELLRFRPEFADAFSNLGTVLRKQGKLEEAAACHQQALRLKPESASAHNNLGVVRLDQGQLAEALACYERAVQLQPDYTEAHWNRACAWLLTGNFAQGWPEFEWRRQFKHLPPPRFSQPAWDGSALTGRTILLYAEQGLGDAMQFIRFAPLVQQRGGRVLVTCHPTLVRLLASCPGVDQVVGQGASLPAFDVQASLLSLPGLLGTKLESIPSGVPYLTPPAGLVEQWRQQLAGSTALRVGIVWQGNPRHENDPCRSVPLAAFEPLTRVADVQLISLQKGPGTEQLPALSDRWGVLDIGSRLSEEWTETAAVLRNLHLVVSVDTAAAHCAGALGTPVWVALPYSPDWRWLLEREDSPWYPSMRLFRQSRAGDWDDVFHRIERALRTWQRDTR